MTTVTTAGAEEWAEPVGWWVCGIEGSRGGAAIAGGIDRKKIWSALPVFVVAGIMMKLRHKESPISLVWSHPPAKIWSKYRRYNNGTYNLFYFIGLLSLLQHCIWNCQCYTPCHGPTNRTGTNHQHWVWHFEFVFHSLKTTRTGTHAIEEAHDESNWNSVLITSHYGSELMNRAQHIQMASPVFV